MLHTNIKKIIELHNQYIDKININDVFNNFHIIKILFNFENN